jgi:hypothetical protein
MEKTDLAKTDKAYFKATAKPALIDLGTNRYLAITGKGDPSGEPFAEAVGALYGVAYALKFSCKAKGMDFVVSKLEGLWWFDQEHYKGVTMDQAPALIPRNVWEYRLLIRIPEYVTREEVEKAVKEKQETPARRGGQVAFFEMTEGKCAQILHTGPFDKEPETLKKLDAFMKEHNFQQNGLHHEIYLSDFRRTAPEKLRTILREPVR